MHVAGQIVRNDSQRGDDGVVATPSEWIYHDVFSSHLWPRAYADDSDILLAEKESDKKKNHNDFKLSKDNKNDFSSLAIKNYK